MNKITNYTVTRFCFVLFLLAIGTTKIAAQEVEIEDVYKTVVSDTDKTLTFWSSFDLPITNEEDGDRCSIALGYSPERTKMLFDLQLIGSSDQDVNLILQTKENSGEFGEGKVIILGLKATNNAKDEYIALPIESSSEISLSGYIARTYSASIGDALGSTYIPDIMEGKLTPWSVMKYINSRLMESDIVYVELRDDNDKSLIAFDFPAQYTTHDYCNQVYQKIGVQIGSSDFYTNAWK